MGVAARGCLLKGSYGAFNHRRIVAVAAPPVQDEETYAAVSVRAPTGSAPGTVREAQRLRRGERRAPVGVREPKTARRRSACGWHLWMSRQRVRSRFRQLGAAIAVGSAVFAVSLPSTADDPPTVHWDPAWSHAGPWDYTLTGVALATVTVETVLWQNVATPAAWQGPILFDAAVRDALRGSTAAIQADASVVSWVLFVGMLTYPFAVDVPYTWARYGRDVAWDLFWQSGTTLALSGAIEIGLRDAIGRVRPAAYQCLTDGGTHCLDAPETTRSFPSGHFVETSASAALLCTQHLRMQLYGSPWDAVTCATAIVAAGTVGTLRIVADDHWASDVIAGGAIGTLIGWGVPTLMHFHRHATPGAGKGSAFMVMPTALPMEKGGGLGAVGVF